MSNTHLYEVGLTFTDTPVLSEQEVGNMSGDVWLVSVCPPQAGLYRPHVCVEGACGRVQTVGLAQQWAACCVL